MAANDLMTLPALLDRAADRRPEGDAFVFPDVRESYAELAGRAAEVARSLRAMGIQPGDPVGILMPNCLDFVHALFGAAMAGALVVTINARLAPRELRHVAADSGMRMLITTDLIADHVDYVARLGEAFPELGPASPGSTPRLEAAPALEHLVLVGSEKAAGFVSGHAFLEQGVEFAGTTPGTEVRPGDPFIMMYTSGTTAMPKGCPLSHESMVRSGLAVGRDAFRLGPDDRMWNPLPMFHVSAQAPMIGVLDATAAYLSMTHFDPSAALDMIASEGATFLFPAFPTITQPLLSHPSYQPEMLAKVRGVLTVGPPEMLRSFQERLPHSAHVSCYGSTELGGIAVVGRLDDPLDARLTCGKPLPGIELEVRDLETGQPLPTGERGVLWARGYNLFAGYHNDPEKTAESFDADGWFNTGDLGSVAPDGSLTFAGRAKDMLKVGGENVACVEIEAFLGTHPAVALAAVVGVPDDKYLEVPVAFVELTPGAAATEEELLEHCRSGLAKFKVPRAVHFVTEWPMSATKIQKFRLRDRLLAQQ